MKIAFSGISREGAQEALRRRAGGRRGRRGLLPLLPALVQFRDESLGAGVDAGAHADLLQECDEPLVLHRVIVGEYLADVARIRKPAALRHAQEQAR